MLKAGTILTDDLYRQPAGDAFCGVVWFWMDGEISKEGIAADLKAMGEKNIKKAILFTISHGGESSPTSVPFMSEKWINLFTYAVQQAALYGVEIGIQSGPGWSSTGGPWITPEHNMQVIRHSEVLVSGNGQEQQIVLPQPRTNLDYYRDAKVIAYPSLKNMRTVEVHWKASQELSSDDEMMLMDGQSDVYVPLRPVAKGKSRYLEVDFSEPQKVYGMRLTHSTPTYSRDVEYENNTCSGGKMQVEDPKGNFRDIGRFELGGYGEFNIGLVGESCIPSIGTKFRLVFDQADRNVFQLGEVELLFQPILSNWMKKAGYYTSRSGDIYEWDSNKNEVKTGLRLEEVVDLTDRMSADGTLRWSVPDGNWTVLRMGHTASGIAPRPLPHGIETSLESDKLDAEATRIHYRNYAGRLAAACGDLAGKSFNCLEIDSWEVGAQNWTAKLPEEFQQRRGYALTPYLPLLLTGRIVESGETSERFLEDYRRTLIELSNENFFKTYQSLCHEDGINVWAESYHSLFADALDVTPSLDAVMSEFWGNHVSDLTSFCPLTYQAQSAAQTYGKKIVPAEAFTTHLDRWTLCPKEMKNLGDLMYASGLNRFIFHRYAHQPWLDREPGMTMGPNGVHFERTNTWWNQSGAYLNYLARCQSILQQGKGAGDVLFIQPEFMPQIFTYVNRMVDIAKDKLDPGFGRIYMTQSGLVTLAVSGSNGTIELPLGTGYSIIVLPDYEEASKAFLEKVWELVNAGAVAVASVKPTRAPGLDQAHDAEVEQLSNRLFGDLDGVKTKMRPIGKGMLTLGVSLKEILDIRGLKKDFDYVRKDGTIEQPGNQSADIRELNFFHRVINGEDVYFIANKTKFSQNLIASFRVNSGSPEIYNPVTTEVISPAVWKRNDKVVEMPLALEPEQSLFVSFRKNKSVSAVKAFLCNGVDAFKVQDHPATEILVPVNSQNTFTMSGWFKPQGNILLSPEKSFSTGPDQPFYDIYPALGHELFGEDQYGAGLSVGNNGIAVTEHGANQLANVLIYKADLPQKTWTHVAVVYRDHKPELFVNGKLVHKGLVGLGKVKPSLGVQHGRVFTQSQGENKDLHTFPSDLTSQQIAEQAKLVPVEFKESSRNDANLFFDAQGVLTLEAAEAGDFTIHFEDGKEIQCKVNVDTAILLNKPWQVQFVSGRGAPKGDIEFPMLSDWSKHPNEGIRYYSGTAIYCTEFNSPKQWFQGKQKFVLDLGEVDVIADVEINGKKLGTLWYAPFAVEVTDVLKPGKNVIKVTVSNVWSNRIIGDLRNPGNKPFTYCQEQLYKPEDNLVPSGLLGPVKITPVASIPIGKHKLF